MALRQIARALSFTARSTEQSAQNRSRSVSLSRRSTSRDKRYKKQRMRRWNKDKSQRKQHAHSTQTQRSGTKGHTPARRLAESISNMSGDKAMQMHAADNVDSAEEDEAEEGSSRVLGDTCDDEDERRADATGKPLSCYLLVSKDSAKRGRSYIGFTVDPVRRERQHNGELAAGAWKTKKLRPAEIAVVVTGFSTKVQALQFEWAWQHPRKSRHVRPAAQALGMADKVKAPKKRVQILFRMLNIPPWSGLPLSVYFPSTRHAEMQRGCCELPSQMRVRIASLENVNMDWQRCGFCGGSKSASDRASALCAACPSCGERFHPTCLAESFLGPEPADCIVPTGGICPSCGTHSTWERWVADNPTSDEAMQGEEACQP